MDFTGLFLGYKRNRPLADEERRNQLKQKERLELPLNYDLCVTRLNSTFMETVDRYYAWRGTLTFFMSICVLLCGSAIAAVTVIVVGRWGEPKGEGDVVFLIYTCILFLPLVGASLWILLKENFTHTYFPIRLNRKARKVYVFRPGRPNRPILVADWDKLFVCLAPCRKSTGPGRDWDIRAHVLADDEETVLDTFAFDMAWDEGDMDALRGHWEFLRRYMEDEDGPKQAYELVGVCMPIAEHRERPRFSLNRFYTNFLGAARFVWYSLLPIWLLCVVGRIVSMWTSQVPKWPEAIEAACRIEPGDPYVKDEHTNPKEGLYTI